MSNETKETASIDFPAKLTPDQTPHLVHITGTIHFTYEVPVYANDEEDAIAQAMQGIQEGEAHFDAPQFEIETGEWSRVPDYASPSTEEVFNSMRQALLNEQNKNYLFLIPEKGGYVATPQQDFNGSMELVKEIVDEAVDEIYKALDTLPDITEMFDDTALLHEDIYNSSFTPEDIREYQRGNKTKFGMFKERLNDQGIDVEKV
jgi:hypothetical protein